MEPPDDNILFKLASLSQEATKLGIKEANRIYNRFWLYSLSYLLIMIAIVHLGWIANVTGFRFFVYPLILCTIPFSFILLLAPDIAKPYVIGKLISGLVIREKIGLDWLSKAIDQYLNIISSVTYFFVWLLLLLTYIDFQHAAYEQYFTIPLLALSIMGLENLHGSKKRFTRFVAVATPKKLYLQFMLTLIKMTMPYDLNDLTSMTLNFLKSI